MTTETKLYEVLRQLACTSPLNSTRATSRRSDYYELYSKFRGYIGRFWGEKLLAEFRITPTLYPLDILAQVTFYSTKNHGVADIRTRILTSDSLTTHKMCVGYDLADKLNESDAPFNVLKSPDNRLVWEVRGAGCEWAWNQPNQDDVASGPLGHALDMVFEACGAYDYKAY